VRYLHNSTGLPTTDPLLLSGYADRSASDPNFDKINFSSFYQISKRIRGHNITTASTWFDPHEQLSVSALLQLATRVTI
jgi:hypothetical protein